MAAVAQGDRAGHNPRGSPSGFYAMDFTAARERMVVSQIEARGIRDARVIEALRQVPRHLFVEAAARDEAYDDRPLPIGSGQTISQPYMVAIMTATLGVEPSDRVLEIGTGSGYQTAIWPGWLGGHINRAPRGPGGAGRGDDKELAITNVEIAYRTMARAAIRRHSRTTGSS